MAPKKKPTKSKSKGVSKKMWIQQAVAKPGSLREYMIKKYGPKALDKFGNLDINMLKAELGKTKNETTQRRLQFAINMRKYVMKKKRK